MTMHYRLDCSNEKAPRIANTIRRAEEEGAKGSEGSSRFTDTDDQGSVISNPLRVIDYHQIG